MAAPTFGAHLRAAAARALAEFPAEAAPGTYAVTFRIDSVDQDPRFPYLAVGYTTEDEVARLLDGPGAPGPWEARWSYAYFPPSGLEGVRVAGHDAERDPEGAALHLRETRERGLWYEEGDPAEDERGERLEEEFRELCVQVARGLHEDGRIEAALGRPLPVVLYDMFDPDAMFALTRAANPPELVADFLTEDPDPDGL
ncbi:hypothetical protein GCM10009801_55700 [Streptomyces albiaxialis]|uniref:Ankyrin n=1 Tax=Streptomyces albiaxialis TaxID=329523 RepID=A0ABN2WEI0_9ACTN